MKDQPKKKNRTPRSALQKMVLILLITALVLGLIGAALLLILNAVVTAPGKERILPLEEGSALTDADCILVLGCQVKADGTPSHMLYDRVMQGVALYKAGAAPLLFMTGDSRREGYDEVGTMKALAIEAGIPDEAIVTDPYGLSTYDSILRAKEVFGYDHVIVVTQGYHLYRAIYIAEKSGVEAHGVDAALRSYGGWFGELCRGGREVLARAKDYVFCLLDPEPEMGYALPDGYGAGRR
ncbi:MAG: YdcF family protein [Clostridia bacterium]|nr:YdcF family protein [Clostridia bacterium]